MESVTAMVSVPMPICLNHPAISFPAWIPSGDSVRTMNRKSRFSPPPGMFRMPSPSLSVYPAPSSSSFAPAMSKGIAGSGFRCQNGTVGTTMVLPTVP